MQPKKLEFEDLNIIGIITSNTSEEERQKILRRLKSMKPSDSEATWYNTFVNTLSRDRGTGDMYPFEKNPVAKNIPAAFFDNKRIKEVFGITGEYDLIIKLKFKDVEEFNDYIINLRKVPAIEKTLTMVVTMTIKEEI